MVSSVCCSVSVRTMPCVTPWMAPVSVRRASGAPSVTKVIFKNCYPQLLHTDHCFPLHFSTVESSLLLVAKSMLTLCYTNIDPQKYFRFDLYLSSIKSEFMTSNTF